MKQLVLILMTAILGFGTLQAQDDFSGTIVYGMSVEGEGAEQMAGMMPEAMEMTFGDGNSAVEIKGGMAAMMMGKIVMLGKKGKAYMIKDSEETIYEMPSREDQEAEGEEMEPEIVKLEDTKEIAGYTCQKYEIKMGEVSSFVWAADGLNPEKPKKGSGGGGMMGISTKGLPGLPLRTETKQGPVTMIMEAKEVKQWNPGKDYWKLPKNYDREEFNMGMFGGGGGGVGY